MHDELKNFLKQATKIQSRMKDTHSALERKEVVGVAGGSMVEVVMNGRHDVSRVKISEHLMDDREILEEMIAGAINDAVRKVDQVNQEAMQDLAGGLPNLDFLR